MFRPPTKYSEYLQDVQKSIDYILRRVNATTVTKIVAGTNVTISPVSGNGVVTVNSTGGGGGGLPVGGTAGQILAKINSVDYNAEWIDNYALWTSTVKHEVKAGEAINKGQAVYVSSADGTNMIVSKASNATEAASSKTLGILAQSLAHNAKGFVITEGLLAGLDTSAATAAGDPVWLGTDGNLLFGLANKPYAPANMVSIGVVTRKNVSNGEIFIRIQNGFELDELHNVDARNPNNNDGIFYNSTTLLWEHKPVSAVYATPTLAQVTTAGNTTTNNITVGTLYFGNGNHYLVTDNSTYAMLSSNRTLQLSTSGNPVLSVFTTQNVAIGTTTDAGYKLDVNGSTRVKGTGTTSATTALSVQSSVGDPIMSVLDDGSCTFGRSGSTTFPATFVGNSGVQAIIGNSLFQSPANILRYGGGVLTFFGHNNNGTGFDFTFNNQQSSTNVNSVMVNLGGTYQNQTLFQFANLRIAPVYDFNANTLNTAIARGIYYNPTITNLRVAAHRAIETTSGDVIINTQSASANAGYTTMAIGGSSGVYLQMYVGTNPTAQTLRGQIWAVGNNLLFNNPSAGYLGLYTTLYSGLTVWPTTGNVYVGASPSTDAGYKLDVNGTARVQTSLEIVSTAGVTFGGGATALSWGGGSQLHLGNSATWADIRFYTGAILKYSQTSSLTTITNTTINLATTTVQLAGVDALAWSGTDIRIGSVAAGFNSLSLYVAGSEKARILSTGNVLIGTTTDAGYKLDVVGADSRFNGVRVGLGAGGVSTNTVVGNSTLASNTTGASITAVGYQALKFTTGSNNTAIGKDAGLNNTTGSDNTYVGYLTGLSSASSVRNTYVGSYAGYINNSGNDNVALGFNSLFANASGSNNTAVGQSALASNTASNNTAVGYQAGYSNTTGIEITAIGYQTLKANTTGSQNTAVGNSCMLANTTGTANVALGTNCLILNTTGNSNVAIGDRAAQGNTTASGNVAVGQTALQANSTSPNNTAIGYAALNASTALNNTAVGFQAGVANTTGANNIFIGSQSTGVSATESNRTWIGNSSTTSTWLAGNVLIGTTTDAGYKVDVTGTIRTTGASTNGVAFYDGTYGAKISMVGYVFTIAREGVNGPTQYSFKYSDASDALYLANTAIRGVPAYDAVMMSRSVYAPHNGGFGFVTYGGTTQYKAIQALYTDNNTSGVAFNYKTGGTDTEAMRITSAGFVGVGTSSPSYPFHISSAAAANIYGTVQSTNANGTAAWVAFNDQSDNVVYRVFGSTVGGTQFGQSLVRSASLMVNLGGAGKFLIGSYSGTDLIFGTSDTARLRLVDSTGNFLVGTMTDAGNKLEVSGSINSTGYKINNTAGYTGILVIATNPPGQQNVDIQGGIIVNIF